jgi:hypothetical protein
MDIKKKASIIEMGRLFFSPQKWRIFEVCAHVLVELLKFPRRTEPVYSFPYSCKIKKVAGVAEN